MCLNAWCYNATKKSKLVRKLRHVAIPYESQLLLEGVLMFLNPLCGASASSIALLGISPAFGQSVNLKATTTTGSSNLRQAGRLQLSTATARRVPSWEATIPDNQRLLPQPSGSPAAITKSMSNSPTNRNVALVGTNTVVSYRTPNGTKPNYEFDGRKQLDRSGAILAG
jgi:hypothetical protein